MTHEPGCICARCGAAMPDPPLDYAYKLPDCVFALPPEQRSRRCNEDFAELEDRKFVRGLLAVPIEGGEEFRYGVWLEVDPGTFERVIRVWNEPVAYRTLEFSGRIANALPPFGPCALDVIVEVATRDEKSRPFVVRSREPWLADLLARGWTHREHLDFASVLRPRAAPPQSSTEPEPEPAS